MAKQPRGAFPSRDAVSIPRSSTSHVAAADSGDGGHPIFCFHFADRQSKNAWRFGPDKADAKRILAKLTEFARMPWEDIVAVDGGSKHHFHPIATIEPKARNDLARIKVDRLVNEELFRFSITSKGRLWGWKQDNTFHVVWWDPEHKVYPVPPREDQGKRKHRNVKEARKKRAANRG
jgi:hypothetical protein